MKIYIFDDQKNNFDNHKNVLFWNSRYKVKNSLDHILEENKESIKKKYLSIIHKIISRSNDNKFLKFCDISLSSISLINEKNVYKSSEIYNCLKLLALEFFIIKNKVKNIEYFGKNRNIDFSINDLSKKLQLDYKKKFFLKPKQFKTIHLFKALYLYIFFFLKNFRIVKLKKKYSDIIFFSYFLHFKRKNSKFYDSYLWDGMSEILKNLNIKSNWFHFYIPSMQIKNISEATEKIKNININNNYEFHSLINFFLKPYYLIYILYKYIKFFLVNFLLLKESDFFINSLSNCTFIFFLKKDFYRSFYGDVMIYNLFNIITFDQILSTIPKQKVGFYLQENQSWEKCMNVLWKKYNHGKLIGYIHSTIRFWDLRYYQLKKEFLLNHNPDLFLFNSAFHKKNAIANNYPIYKCKIVEGLRYNNYLNFKQQKIKKKYILILGDIDNFENLYILDMFQNISKKISNYKIFFKPHPGNNEEIIYKIKKKYNFIIIDESTKNFHLGKYEKIICTNSTSAILDCIIIKKNFCVVRSTSKLDMFPLNSYELSIKRIFSDEELFKFIKYGKNEKIKNRFLLLNKLNPAWKKLINFYYFN